MPTLTCTQCNTPKDRAEFKRLATLAQSRAWIKNPLATKRITYIGKICNACHKQTARKPTELTPEEYRKRMINEGKAQDEIDYLHRNRIAKGKRKMQTNAVKMLRKRREDLFPPVIETINTLVRQSMGKLRYLKSTQQGKEVFDRDVAIAIGFAEICLGQAMKARDRIRLRKKTGGAPPARWQELMTEADHAERAKVYALLSGDYKDRFAEIHKQFL